MKKFFLICVIMCVLLTACSSKKLETITVAQSEISMFVGESRSINISLTPSDISENVLKWSSSDESVATVKHGSVTAVAPGTASITIMGDNGVKAYCDISVKDIEIKRVDVTPSSVSLKVDEKVQLQADVYPSKASDADLEWSSQDSSIAVVNTSGYVTGVKAGTTTISCTAGNGKKSTCIVKVNSKAKKNTNTNTDTNTNSNTQQTQNVDYPQNNYYSDYRDYDDDFVFPDSSYRRLSSGEIYGLSKDTVQRAINEIYARNGYVFNNQAYQNYFSSKAWYSPNYDFTDSDLTSIEHYNVDLLSEYR